MSKKEACKTIGIIAIKGGVGKTTTVSNLGAVMANEFGKKVLIVDANFSAPNLGLHLGIVNPDTTIHDVLDNRKPITSAIYEHEYGFHIIPAALMPKKKIDPYNLKKKLEPLKQYYDVILLDSSPSLNEEILATMVAADDLYVVTTPDYPTLSCTMHAAKVAKQKNISITGLILNKVRNKKFELSISDIENATKVPVVGVVPDDIKVLEALAITTPAVLHKPKSDAAVEYKKLAAAMIGEEYKDTRIMPIIKKLFKR